jgi:hypothetical protein
MFQTKLMSTLRTAICLELCFPVLRCPGLYHRVVIFSVGHGNFVVHIIANRLALDVEFRELLVSLLFLLRLVLLQLLHLLQELTSIFLGLLFLPYLLLQGIDGGTDLCCSILCLSVVFKPGNNLVYNFDGRIALPLRLADLLWVAAALCDEVVTAPPC